jgi:hypothetical protein
MIAGAARVPSTVAVIVGEAQTTIAVDDIVKLVLVVQCLSGG